MHVHVCVLASKGIKNAISSQSRTFHVLYSACSGANWVVRPTKMVSSHSEREPTSIGEVESIEEDTYCQLLGSNMHTHSHTSTLMSICTHTHGGERKR